MCICLWEIVEFTYLKKKIVDYLLKQKMFKLFVTIFDNYEIKTVHKFCVIVSSIFVVTPLVCTPISIRPVIKGIKSQKFKSQKMFNTEFHECIVH